MNKAEEEGQPPWTSTPWLEKEKEVNGQQTTGHQKHGQENTGKNGPWIGWERLAVRKERKEDTKAKVKGIKAKEKVPAHATGAMRWAT